MLFPAAFFSRHRLSCGDCLEDKKEGCKKCSVLCYILELYTLISITMHTSCSYRCRKSLLFQFGLGILCVLGCFLTRDSFVVLEYFLMSVLNLVFNSNANDCLQRFISDMCQVPKTAVTNPVHLLQTSSVFVALVCW